MPIEACHHEDRRATTRTAAPSRSSCSTMRRPRNPVPPRTATEAGMSCGEPGKSLLPPQAADYTPFGGAAQAAFPRGNPRTLRWIVPKNRMPGWTVSILCGRCPSVFQLGKCSDDLPAEASRIGVADHGIAPAIHFGRSCPWC